MKEHRRSIAIIGSVMLLLFAVVIFLVATTLSDAPDPTYPTIENASVIYEDAIDILNSSDNISLRISYKKETLLGDEFLTEQSVQNITYQGLVSDSLKASATEKLMVGNHTVELSEIFTEGNLYLTIDDCQFFGDMDSKSYLSRYSPAQLLHTELYKTITGENTGNGYTIFFSDPLNIESWASTNTTQLRQSSGTAYIDASGQLTKSVYTVSYTVDNLHIRLSATVEIIYDNTAPISVPSNTETYIKLTSPDAPRMMEKACGYLLDATDVQGTCIDTIYCEAFGDTRKQTVTLKTAQNTAWSAQVDTSVEIINSSKAGTSTNYTQQEIFKDNTYTISVDSAPKTINKDIDINAMRSYCQDLLVGTILLPQHIANASVSESEDMYIIELTGNDSFAKIIDAEACATLYQNPHILSETAQSYEVDTMRCYLTIDKNTGLPIGSGLDYKGSYTIEQFPYLIAYQSDHQYTILTEEAGA